jgi:Ala-tRNA(Pro) deacylase
MPLTKKLIKFLSKIKYELISHRTVYTAFDKAKTLKVPEKIVGKTLVIKMDGDFALVLIPANKILDIKKFLKIANKQKKKRFLHADFVTEAWIKKNLKGVKVGAIPPFGNLWHLATFVEGSLLKEPKIIINGGDYNSSIKISPSSFKKLIPDLIIGSFTKVKK